MDIGNTLKQARLLKGYTLADAEEATKIRARYLEALENEEFNVLPGRVYVIAFLRNYARYLGLNDDELVQQYKQMINTEVVSEETATQAQDSLEEKPSRRPRERRRRRKPNYLPILLIVAVLAIVFAATLAYKVWSPGDVPKEPKVVERNEQPKPAPEQSEPTPAAEENKPEPQVQQGVEIVLNVTEANCWVSVDVDGQAAFAGTITSGDVKTFSGKEKIKVRLGDAGAVEVKYNGEDLGKLGSRGEVKEREFTAQES